MAARFGGFTQDSEKERDPLALPPPPMLPPPPEAPNVGTQGNSEKPREGQGGNSDTYGPAPRQPDVQRVQPAGATPPRPAAPTPVSGGPPVPFEPLPSPSPEQAVQVQRAPYGNASAGSPLFGRAGGLLGGGIGVPGLSTDTTDPTGFFEMMKRRLGNGQ